MSDDKDKYLDPAKNPFIKIRGDDLPPVVEDEDDPGFNAEDFRIPLDGYRIPEKKAAAASSPPAKEKPEVEPGDFEEKVKTFMEKIDEVIIVRPVEGVGAFKISKRPCGSLEIIDPDGSRRTLTALDPEERKIVNYNLYVKCAKGKDGECPCNQI